MYGLNGLPDDVISIILIGDWRQIHNCVTKTMRLKYVVLDCIMGNVGSRVFGDFLETSFVLTIDLFFSFEPQLYESDIIDHQITPLIHSSLTVMDCYSGQFG